MPKIANEWKLVSIHTFLASSLRFDVPENAVRYWRKHVEKAPHFNAGSECLTVLILNSRKRIVGHQLVSIGTVDSVLVHAREVFRTAIVANASAIVLVHNHPSGESSPSLADERMTRHLVNAGRVVDITLVDHIIVTKTNFASLAEKGMIQNG